MSALFRHYLCRQAVGMVIDMNVLAVGAHFDDVELGCGGSLAKHVQEGDSAFIFVATRSGFENAQKQILRSDEQARSEGEKASKIIGAELLCGDFQTLDLAFDDRLDDTLVTMIEQKQIDVMYIPWRYDVHHDHTILAQACLHAGRHLNRILMYRSNFYSSDQPFYKNFYVDISGSWERKRKAILAYTSEMERVGLSWLEYAEAEAKNNGKEAACQYAEVFQCVKWKIDLCRGSSEAAL